MKRCGWLLCVLLLCLTVGQAKESVRVDSLMRKAILASEQKKYAESFDLLTQVKAVAEDERDAALLFRVYSNWGINLAELLNYSDALDYFFKAYQIAVNQLDMRSEMSVINNIAVLYMLNGKYQKANEYFKRNFQYALEIQDSLFMGGVSMNIASTALELDSLDEADHFLDIADQVFTDYPQERLSANIIRLSYWYEAKSYTRLLELGNRLLSELGKQKEYVDECSDILLIMSRTYRELGETNQAVQAALAIVPDSNKLDRTKDLYVLLSDLFRRKGDYQKALVYTDSLILINDLIRQKENRLGFENNRIQFELLRKEQELAEYHAKYVQHQILLISMIVVSGLLVWAFANQKIRGRQQRKIIELKLEQECKNQELLQNRLREQETQALLKQQQFQNELEQKNRELMSKAMFMANRNELIRNIICSLSQNMQVEKNSQLDRNIQDLRRQLGEDKEWDNFITYFEQVNEDFVTRLKEKHPNLTANEIRFLSLIYIGLSSKEISSLLNITSEYCKKKRQQVAQKMGLESTSFLYKYLSNIVYCSDN